MRQSAMTPLSTLLRSRSFADNLENPIRAEIGVCSYTNESLLVGSRSDAPMRSVSVSESVIPRTDKG